jgi:hypothetical protein
VHGGSSHTGSHIARITSDESAPVNVDTSATKCGRLASSLASLTDSAGAASRRGACRDQLRQASAVISSASTSEKTERPCSPALS